MNLKAFDLKLTILLSGFQDWWKVFSLKKSWPVSRLRLYCVVRMSQIVIRWRSIIVSITRFKHCILYQRDAFYVKSLHTTSGSPWNISSKSVKETANRYQVHQYDDPCIGRAANDPRFPEPLPFSWRFFNAQQGEAYIYKSERSLEIIAGLVARASW